MKVKIFQSSVIVVLVQITLIVLKLANVLYYWNWWYIFYPIWIVLGLIIWSFVLLVLFTINDLITDKMEE